MRVQLGVKDVWQLLNGVLCVYKPRDVSVVALKKRIVEKIVEKGNELDDSLVPFIQMPIVEPHPISQALVVVGSRKQLDYTRHPLMVGKAFRPEDIMLEEIREMEPSSSGVCPLAIGSECYEIDRLRNKSWLNTYRIDGKLGEETEQHKIRGKIIVKAEWEHVTKRKLEKFLTRIRAQYKRMSFKLAEVDLQSQEAFEIARKGAPRPKILDCPVVYDVRITKFQPPYFGLSIQVVGETDYFLRGFIHETGLSLGSTACPKKLRKIRVGPFGIDHALLEKELSLENILKNILMCNKLVSIAQKYENERVIQVKRAAELESNNLVDEYRLNHEQDSDDEDNLNVPWGREYSTV